MLKTTLLALLLSLCVVFFAREFGLVLHYIVYAHTLIVDLLSNIFAGGKTGNIIRHTIALFLIPLCIALIPYLICRVFLHKSFQYFNQALWISWTILATVFIMR